MKYFIHFISLCFILIFVFGCVESDGYRSPVYHMRQDTTLGTNILYQENDPRPVYIILEPGAGAAPQRILEMFGFTVGSSHTASETKAIKAEMADKLGTTTGPEDFWPSPSTNEIGWRYNPYPYSIKIERGLVYTLDGRYIGKYKDLPKLP